MRHVGTKPQNMNQLKCRTVRRVFQITTKHIKTLQECSTPATGDECVKYPKSQHFMFTYDELAVRPNSGKQIEKRRANPQSVFLVPPHCDIKALGRALKAV